MAEFTAITTQEEFDAAISARLKRERETVSKELGGQLKEMQDKIGGYETQISDLNGRLKEAGDKAAAGDKTIAELQGKIKGYETSSVKMRIAHENGIPYELADRLAGETEDDIRKDAQALSKLVSRKPAPPLADPEGNATSKDAALKKMLQSLNGKGE